MSRTRPLMAALSGVVLAVALSSCTAEPPRPAASPSVSSASTASPPGGVLRIGTLFPVTGAQAYLGGAQAAGVAVAVKEINDAGGVDGHPVEVLSRDSGDVSTSTIEASVADLVAKGADVIIGPSSSVLAERIMPKIVAARIPMISPAATGVRLSSVASGGYFFRTIGSTALEGSALARSIGDGKAKVALVYADDDMGRGILGTLRASLEASGGSLVTAQAIGAANDVAAAVAAAKAAAPDDVVYVSTFGAMEQNKAVITQLTAAGLGGAKLWLTSENTADYSQALPAGLLTNVNGILEGAQPDAAFAARVKAADPAVGDLSYAEEAYDATIAAALAATVGAPTAASDAEGVTIARHLPGVSRGGIKCTTFAECLDVLKTRSDIDYDGISGPIAFDANGDTAPAHFGLFRYDAAGRFARVGDVLAG